MLKLNRLLILAFLMTSAAGAAAVRAEGATAPPAPCAGLLCSVTPDSMGTPITESDAARISAQQQRDVADRQKRMSLTIRQAATRLTARHTPAASSARRLIVTAKIVPVTIAAGDMEIGRARTLASVISKPRIKIIRVEDLPRNSPADLTVETALRPGHPSVRLFRERLVILASGKIKNIRDLSGHNVSFGLEGSSTQQAARALFQSLGIAPHETPLDLSNALDGVSTGDLDAVVVLAPPEFQGLAGLKQSGFHLLSLPKGAPMPAGMVLSAVDPREYPGLDHGASPIHMAGTDVVLHVGAKRNEAPAKAMLSALDRHSAELASRGFDLIAGNDLRTARSVAKDASQKK